MTSKEKLLFVSSFVWFLHWGTCLASTILDTVILKSSVRMLPLGFLNKFYPRHKIDVDIVHRGLKREGVYGYCDVVGEQYRPRHFLIELQPYMSRELYIKILFHELTHLSPVGRWFTAVSAWKIVLFSRTRGKMGL